MKKYLLFFSALLIATFGSAQHEADNWCFGQNAGLNFTSGSPVAFYGSAIYTNEGCSTVSDASGNLLFYTDGVSVWDRNDTLMPNGTGLMGGISATQSALIVPMPGSNIMYYIFTVDEIGGPNGFRYSIVDMTLQGGLGDVNSTKNILVQSNVTEKLTAQRQRSGVNAWIAVHEWGTNAFDLYDLSAAGLQTTPVISNTGTVHNTSVIQNTYGQMKFSPCGDKIAVAIGYQNTVEIFSFDDNMGIVANPITLPMTDHVYGIEFSRDGTKLYVSNYDPSGTLVQFDLTSGNAATILASEVVISMTADIYALQMANNGKIYVNHSFGSSLGVINSPDLAGIACNYVDAGVDLDPLFMGVTSALGLPGFVQSAFRSEPVCPVTTGTEAINTSEKTILYPNPSTDDFTIQFPEYNFPTEIKICDASGKMVERHNLISASSKYTFGKSLTQGIYFINIKSDKNVEVIKAIKFNK